MISEETKDRLAIANGLGEERYVDRVRAGVRKVMSADDELAILRKAVVVLYDIISNIHPDVDLPELEAYDLLVESIKAEYSDLKNSKKFF